MASSSADGGFEDGLRPASFREEISKCDGRAATDEVRRGDVEPS